jgi:MFS family permease
LSGQRAMAGVPGAVFVLGQDCGAGIWGYAMEFMGRRRAIALGQLIGVAGSTVAMFSVVNRSFLFFLAGLVMTGMARSAVDLGRFVAAEVHRPAQRGRAISNVVLGSTAGAIFGPLLVGPTGQLAMRAGLSELAGPYGLGIVVLVLAAACVFAGLRPDPREIGRELVLIQQESLQLQAARPLREILQQPEVIVAMIVVIFAQMVMMVPMSITSVHMKAHQHSLNSVSLVISAHTLGMYAFSVVSGRITDRWGRVPVIILGSAILILSCVMGAPSVNLLPLTVSLFLLGLGWNFAYVAGSALLADQLSPKERAKTQGFNDLLLNFASAMSQAGSGVIYAAGGFGIMCGAAALMAAVPLSLALWRHFAIAQKRTFT